MMLLTMKVLTSLHEWMKSFPENNSDSLIICVRVFLRRTVGGEVY